MRHMEAKAKPCKYRLKIAHKEIEILEEPENGQVTGDRKTQKYFSLSLITLVPANVQSGEEVNTSRQ